MSEAIDRYAGVANALATVRERMARAAERSGRPLNAVGLVAVTKFHPAEAVLAAYAAGARIFGENRVQEAEAKFAGLGLEGASLHLLGHLQSNKAKKAAVTFDCVQSIDSASLLEELARRASDAGRVIDVLLELHTGEESKSGFGDEDELLRALELAATLTSLRPRGIMTMAPFTDDAVAVRRSFRLARAAFERARSELGARDPAGEAFDTLSMGMTGDFEAAIEEGSTMVRIGTALFGSRAAP